MLVSRLFTARTPIIDDVAIRNARFPKLMDSPVYYFYTEFSIKRPGTLLTFTNIRAIFRIGKNIRNSVTLTTHLNDLLGANPLNAKKAQHASITC